MASDVKLTADSSPSEILKSMSPQQHKAWRETGATPDIPEATPAPKTETAESSPAAKTEVSEQPSKAAETSAESVPAKSEPSKPAKGAEGRIKELLADNKRLTAELETARKAPVAPKAKNEEIAKPRRNDVDDKTGQPKYATDDDFLDARDAYVAKMSSQQARADIAKEEGDRRVAEQNRLVQQKWQNSLKIANERHPDFAKVCEIDAKGAFQNAELKQIKTNSILDAFILDSEIGGSILYHLASTPGEVAKFEGMSAFAAARELTKLEDKLSGTASTQPAKTEEKKTEGSKKVSGAPAPAASVGGRSTAPVDEAEAAVKGGDFRRYFKAANEEDFRKKKAS